MRAGWAVKYYPILPRNKNGFNRFYYKEALSKLNKEL